ncbi:MAG: hypothetical protein ACREDZ_14790, partial [Kiloniellales bacterium]
MAHGAAGTDGLRLTPAGGSPAGGSDHQHRIQRLALNRRTAAMQNTARSKAEEKFARFKQQEKQALK